MRSEKQISVGANHLILQPTLPLPQGGVVIFPAKMTGNDDQTINCSHKMVELSICGMGPLLVLVSPCFRENSVVTCKIGSFLCSLENLLQKNVIVFFFENQISRLRSFEKRAIFDLLFTFSIHHGKVTQIPSARISLTYIHTCILLTLLTFFCLTNFEKNTNLSGMVSLWFESWC